MNFFEKWRMNGSHEITDPAEMNHCLNNAIDSKDKQAILDLYDADKCDWEEEDSLADEYDLIIDTANEILYS